MPTGYPDYQAPTNITAQDLAELEVDIVAQTLDKLGIDIEAQTISTLDQDIKVQSLSELVQRPKYGTVVSNHGAISVAANDYQDVITVSGTGNVYGAMVRIDANTGSELVDFNIWPDNGFVVPSKSFQWYNNRGFGASTPHYQLLEYGVDSECFAMITPIVNIPFESSCKLHVFNSSSNTQTGDGWLIYATI